MKRVALLSVLVLGFVVGLALARLAPASAHEATAPASVTIWTRRFSLGSAGNSPPECKLAACTYIRGNCHCLRSSAPICLWSVPN